MAEPYLETDPADAARAGVAPANPVRVASRNAEAVVRARVTGRTLEGSVFMPMHWNPVRSSKARAGAMVAAHVEPVSGHPEGKAEPVAAALFAAARHGVAALLFRGERERGPHPSRRNRTGLARRRELRFLPLGARSVPRRPAAG